MISSTNNFEPRTLEGVVFCSGRPDILQITLPWNLKQWDSVVLVACIEDVRCSEIAKAYGAHRSIVKGTALETALSSLIHRDWAMFVDDDILLPSNFREVFNEHAWNPEVLYSSTRRKSSLPFNGNEQDLVIQGSVSADASLDRQYRGYFQLFHSSARALRDEKKVDCLTQQWPDSEKCLLDLSIVQLLAPRNQRT